MAFSTHYINAVTKCCVFCGYHQDALARGAIGGVDKVYCKGPAGMWPLPDPAQQWATDPYVGNSSGGVGGAGVTVWEYATPAVGAGGGTWAYPKSSDESASPPSPPTHVPGISEETIDRDAYDEFMKGL